MVRTLRSHSSLSLSGIDADASSVSVAITDGETIVAADATNDGSGWVVADQDLSGLADWYPYRHTSVTDASQQRRRCL